MAFFVGDGVYTHKGKDYGFGAKLPETVDAATLASMKKKGKVSDTAPASAPGPAPQVDTSALTKQIVELTGKLAAAEADAEAQGAAVVELTGKLDAAEADAEAQGAAVVELTGKLDAAEEQLERAQATIQELTSQAMNTKQAGKK